MKIKNTSGEDRLVSWLGGRMVLAGQVVDVPEADVYSYTQQSIWEPADAAAKAVHKNALDGTSRDEDNDAPEEVN